MNPGRPRRSPGWYQDPDDPTRVRHWNGRGWTGRRRLRPTWHVLPNDLEPDPGWVSPGGISASALRELLGDKATTDPAGYNRSDDLADRRFGFESPPVDDRHTLDDRQTLDDGHSLDEPYRGDPLSGPLHAERPARDWGSRSDHSRGDSRPPRGPGATFGPEPGWPLRPRATPWGFGGGGSVHHGAGTSPTGSVPAAGWRRSRVPLIVVVGLTIFSVLALLVNLGTGARARFSAVAVDRAFVSQASTACVTALGGRNRASDSVMTAGSKSPASGSSTVVTGPKLPASSKSPANPGTAARAGSASVLPDSAATQLTVLADLSSRLGGIAATPTARPQVQAWLGEWGRYLAAERDLPKAEAAHDDSAVTQDRDSARVAAASADLFAADNGLGACSIGSTGSGGFESVP